MHLSLGHSMPNPRAFGPYKITGLISSELRWIEFLDHTNSPKQASCQSWGDALIGVELKYLVFLIHGFYCWFLEALRQGHGSWDLLLDQGVLPPVVAATSFEARWRFSAAPLPGSLSKEKLCWPWDLNMGHWNQTLLWIVLRTKKEMNETRPAMPSGP